MKGKPGGVLTLGTTVPRTGHGCVTVFSGLRKFVLGGQGGIHASPVEQGQGYHLWREKLKLHA